MSNTCHRLRTFSAAPLVVRLRYLIKVPSPLTAAPLVACRTKFWPLRRCALRVLNRGARADARPAVRALASTVRISAVRKAPGARQYPAIFSDNAEAPGEVFARLAGSRDASGSTGRGERAYVMRIDDRARGTYAAATPAVLKVSGARQ
jgi:hypothetical protein